MHGILFSSQAIQKGSIGFFFFNLLHLLINLHQLHMHAAIFNHVEASLYFVVQEEMCPGARAAVLQWFRFQSVSASE